MTTITADMAAQATRGLIARGYSFKHPATEPDLVWLQSPGELPAAAWWPICRMGRTEAWALVWNLYQQELF